MVVLYKAYRKILQFDLKPLPKSIKVYASMQRSMLQILEIVMKNCIG